MKLPVFKALVENPDDRYNRKVTFACAACGELGRVDVATRFCRPCWRVCSLLSVMLGDVLREVLDAEREAGAARGEDQ